MNLLLLKSVNGWVVQCFKDVVDYVELYDLLEKEAPVHHATFKLLERTGNGLTTHQFVMLLGLEGQLQNLSNHEQLKAQFNESTFYEPMVNHTNSNVFSIVPEDNAVTTIVSSDLLKHMDVKIKLKGRHIVDITSYAFIGRSTRPLTRLVIPCTHPIYDLIQVGHVFKVGLND
jgi:hypothetical protein